MLKILNRIDKDIYKITEILSEASNDNSDIDINFQTILIILDYGSYKKNTIMYNEETNEIFIYDEESHKMITNQQEIKKFVCSLINSSIEKNIKLMKKINTLTEDDLKELIK